MSSVHAVPFALQLPAGAHGPTPVTSDVRCFLLPHAGGVVLVDAGLPGSVEAVGAGLSALSAGWSDVSDVVVSHAHFDHVGGLSAVLAAASASTLWAGAAEVADVEAASGGRVAQPLRNSDRVAGWSVVATPGHTLGHVCLVSESDGVLLAGDVVGSIGGELVRPPHMFTTDATRAETSLRELAALRALRLVTSHGPELQDGPARLQHLVAATTGPEGSG